jgi:molybdopterin molybdotransferase
MLTYAEALALIDALPVPRRVERVPLSEGSGRILADDLRLDRDQPPFDRATMDGYAIALAPGGAPPFTRYRVVGTVLAGQVFAGTVAPGQAVRIMTGAPCPRGTTVVPIEACAHLDVDGAVAVTIADAKMLPRSPAQRRFVAAQGEDGHAGDTILTAGTRLGPVTLSVAAMAGARELGVFARPRLAIVTTGDELEPLPANGTPREAAARIADSNGPFLSAFAAALGLISVRTLAPDDAAALQAEIGNGAAVADIVVTTGGVSAGDKDLVPPAAAALGYQTVFHHVAMQPGKPVFLARKGERYVVGLPGNPVSVVATAHVVLWPLLARFGAVAAPRWRRLPLAVDWRHRGNRQVFQPARITAMGVEPIRWNGSGDLIAAAAADGLVDLAPESDLEVGAMVNILPYVGGSGEGQRGQLPPRNDTG